jgi:hypothetical protein
MKLSGSNHQPDIKDCCPHVAGELQKYLDKTVGFRLCEQPLLDLPAYHCAPNNQPVASLLA